MTVREMLSRMSAVEWATWKAVYQVDPFDEGRADLRAGIVAATIANVNRPRGRAPYPPAQFMPYHQQQPKVQEAQIDRKAIAIGLREALQRAAAAAAKQDETI